VTAVGILALLICAVVLILQIVGVSGIIPSFRPRKEVKPLILYLQVLFYFAAVIQTAIDLSVFINTVRGNLSQQFCSNMIKTQVFFFAAFRAVYFISLSFKLEVISTDLKLELPVFIVHHMVGFYCLAIGLLVWASQASETSDFCLRSMLNRAGYINYFMDIMIRLFVFGVVLKYLSGALKNDMTMRKSVATTVVQGGHDPQPQSLRSMAIETLFFEFLASILTVVYFVLLIIALAKKDHTLQYVSFGIYPFVTPLTCLFSWLSSRRMWKRKADTSSDHPVGAPRAAHVSK